MEDLSHAHFIYWRDWYNSREDECVESISAIISRGKTSPGGLSSKEATALVETFREVPPLRQISSQSLIPPMIRTYTDRLASILGRVVQTCGSDFGPTPCSVDRGSSPAWNCAITPPTTILDSRTSGRENTVGNRCALKWFGGITWTTRRWSKRYGDRFIQSEAHSVRFIPGIPLCGREKARFSSECTPCHPGFGGAVSALHHKSVDARREHYPVHKSEPSCQSSHARTCLLGEIDGNNLLIRLR